MILRLSGSLLRLLCHAVSSSSRALASISQRCSPAFISLFFSHSDRTLLPVEERNLELCAGTQEKELSNSSTFNGTSLSATRLHSSSCTFCYETAWRISSKVRGHNDCLGNQQEQRTAHSNNTLTSDAPSCPLLI